MNSDDAIKILREIDMNLTETNRENADLRAENLRLKEEIGEAGAAFDRTLERVSYLEGRCEEGLAVVRRLRMQRDTEKRQAQLLGSAVAAAKGLLNCSTPDPAIDLGEWSNHHARFKQACERAKGTPRIANITTFKTGADRIAADEARGIAAVERACGKGDTSTGSAAE